jgi:hypothetical protein
MEIAAKAKSPRKISSGKELLEQEAKRIEERERGLLSESFSFILSFKY